MVRPRIIEEVNFWTVSISWKNFGGKVFLRGGFEGSVLYCYEGDELCLHDGIVGAEERLR